MKVILGQHFNVIKKIATTRFSTIYLGQDMRSNKYVALKLELFNSDIPQLDIEYNFLQRFQKVTGFPKLYHYGYESDYRLLVIDYFKYSLQDLFDKCHNKFSLKTVLMIADQIISRIEYIHKYEQIHRDIKPENFMFNEKEGIIYAIDFGFFKKCPQARSSNIISHSKFKKKSFTGTLRYASINALNGKEQYKRDDLESLAYMLIYFLKGNLPWSGGSKKNITHLQYKPPKLEDTQTRIELAVDYNYITKEEAESMIKNRVTPIKRIFNSKLHHELYYSTTPDNSKSQNNSTFKSTPVSISNSTSKNTSNYTSKTTSIHTSTTISKSNSIILSTPADPKTPNISTDNGVFSDRKKILAIKKEISPEILCQNCPEEFCIFLKSVRSLKTSDVPKYGQYRMMFRDLFIRSGFVYDGKYDWNFVYEETKSLPVIKQKKTSYSRPITRLPSPRDGIRSHSSTSKNYKKKYLPIIDNTRLVSSNFFKNQSRKTSSNSIENSNESIDENDPELQSISMDADNMNTNLPNYYNNNQKIKGVRSKTTISSPRSNCLNKSKLPDFKNRRY